METNTTTRTVWVLVDTERENGPTPIELVLGGGSHRTLEIAREWAHSYERPVAVTLTTGAKQ